MKDIWEKFNKIGEIYDTIPKGFFKRDLVNGVETISCPCCGIIFALVDWNITASFEFKYPTICCGRLLK